MLGALLDRLPGRVDQQGEVAGGGLELVVTLKVTNPNRRSLDITALSGAVAGPEGELGTFRLPPGKSVPLPANGTVVMEVLAEPGSGFLVNALPLVLSRAKRAEIKASGHVDVATWLGVRRIEFKDVRLGGATAPAEQPPALGTAPRGNQT